jgi:hypothetical protein
MDGKSRARLAVWVTVLAAYVSLAALQEGPIQVWLLVFAPIALAVAATALRVIDPSEPG